MIYTTIYNIYDDIIKYNEDELIYSGEHNIPTSNKYYIFITDINNNVFMKYYEELFSSVEDNLLQDKIRVNFDEDQVFMYDVLRYKYKDTDKILKDLYNNANEEGGKVCVILDIEFILNFIQYTEENSGIENHIFDYIIYKLRHKIDKIFVLDEKELLQKNSLLYRDILSFYRNKKEIIPTQFYVYNKHTNKNEYFENNYITIYKNKDNMYWKILDNNSTIDFSEDFGEDHDYEDKIIKININKTESLITLTEIDDDILFGNIFTKENMVKVLHPITKNSIFYE